MFVKIKGTGSCLPEKVLDNFEISQLVDTNDEWIQSRTGIKSRHIAREETAVSMAKISYIFICFDVFSAYYNNNSSQSFKKQLHRKPKPSVDSPNPSSNK